MENKNIPKDIRDIMLQKDKIVSRLNLLHFVETIACSSDAEKEYLENKNKLFEEYANLNNTLKNF